MRKITKITGNEMSRASGTAIKTESKIQFVFLEDHSQVRIAL